MPDVRVSPPLPLMLPENIVEPFEMVSVWPPKLTLPAPESVLIVAPAVVPEMSNVPAATLTRLELERLPVPVSASVPPEISVAPE